MRVLLLAEACNPEWASTPYFAYRICQAIARRVDHAVLATQVRNRPAMERQPVDGAETVFIDTEAVGRPFWRLSRFISRDKNKAMTLKVAMAYPSYLTFEWKVWKRFQADLRRGAFDLVHRVSPLSPTLPSPMAKWSPVPFIIGPVNGGLKWPKPLHSVLRREREWMTYLRGFHVHLPFHRSGYTRAAAILAGFDHTIRDLPLQARDRTFDCPDVGYEGSELTAPPRREPRDRLTFLFVGRLVPYKCPDVVVQAFAASSVLRGQRLVLIGDGPERARIERIIAENDLGGRVELPGWLPHEQVVQAMRQADVFAFPSIRELGAGVVIEAMSAALPCAVVDYGAPGVYIDQDRGIKVPLTDKDQLVRNYTAALETLVADPDRRIAMGLAAHEYVKTRHSWDIKAEKIIQVYDWVLGHRAEKPDFFSPN
jgi:glycosyltransferase involved in cell wall biosynthesis